MGLFCAFDRAAQHGELSEQHREYLEESLDWFNHSLKVPNLGRHEWRAVFWFWDSAQKHIDRMWELAWGLKALDVPVEMVTCRFPGRIIYHDEYQIAAVPHQGRHRDSLKRLL